MCIVYASYYYTTSFWRKAYTKSIYPVLTERDWIVPQETKEVVVLAPEKHHQSEKPKKKIISFVEEFSKKKSQFY